MTELPKPAKRERKPRKPLPRVHAGGKRKRTPARIKECQADVSLADRLASFLVEQMTAYPHLGTEAHHLISRRKRSVRWDLDNLVWLSREQHEFVQRRKAENELLALSVLGPTRWEALNRRAKAFRAESPREAVERLRLEIEARGLWRAAELRGLL